ncbi:MAG: 2-amino-4-hydroxy-6-hydroxymethyldihydropteridine diphosphokinase [Candidatus Omnitrophica bacterium 4484_171]|nr:MAG: 2-amino-4-hydroxy-6-hydroxymethyldihydropteridine diphosphokinase [Candidatus Omnitrophica bacterium 4484_171]
MVTAFIGVGSNLGDREKNIRRAVSYLKTEKGIKVEKVSTLIETEPQGGPPQGKYLNGVIRINTTLSVGGLLNVLHSIEDKLGRKRLVRFGPRTIDLDILLYGSETIDSPDLKVPHPRMFERKFVLKPLLEIEPGLKSCRVFIMNLPEMK